MRFFDVAQKDGDLIRVWADTYVPQSRFSRAIIRFLYKLDRLLARDQGLDNQS
jgi:hypothetical protein